MNSWNLPELVLTCVSVSGSIVAFDPASRFGVKWEMLPGCVEKRACANPCLPFGTVEHPPLKGIG
jgi:hypothetical protein